MSRFLSEYAGRESGSAILSLLASRSVMRALTAMAAGEMAADKLPNIPSRTEPAPLIGRAALGALSGYTVADYRGGNKLAGALLGAFSAVGTTFFFYRIRKEVAERTSIPDFIVAGMEDAVVLKGGSSLVEMMDE